MPIIRAQVIIPMLSALPEDACVNTFHFNSTGGTLATDLDTITDLVQDFYFATPTGEGGPIRAYWGAQVDEDDVHLRLYNLSSPEPRAPLRDTDIGVEGSVSGTGLPDEVALCLSFQAPQVSGSPQSRRRGRIFFGPLGQNALSGTVPNNRPDAGFVGRLAQAGEDLMNNAAATSAPWVVYSPTDDAGYLVDNGWVDNAFDTQRRRGVSPTTRTTWS